MADRTPGIQKKTKQGKRPLDYNMLAIILILCVFGLVMLYSTSSYVAAYKFKDAGFYLKKQLVAMLLGFAALTIMAKTDYRIWKKYAVWIYIAAFLLCGAVIFKGSNYNGSQRWLKIGPVSFQPSEFAKIAVIIFLASIVDKMPKQMSGLWSIMKSMFTLVPLIGIVAYSNLSTAIIIAGIAVSMLFVASTKYRYFIGIGAAGAAFIGLFIMLESYRMGRIQAWLNPEEAGDAAFQTIQGLYAIGSGGIFGKGLGQSLQKLGFVPEAQNDMIFSIICEELGLIGGLSIMLLFILLVWRLMVIASHARDLYGALLASGIMAHISLQVMLNIAVVSNTIPNTGVTLPFVSYGGTSLLFLMSEMGLALSVSRGISSQEIHRRKGW